jgi:hypothetical protein
MQFISCYYGNYGNKKRARFECDIICVPLFADINVFNPYNSDIIVFSLEWCPGTTPEFF